MANVLVLSLIFSPDNVSTAQIMCGIAEDLVHAGHHVRVITTTPHYHRDLAMEATQPLHKWLGRFICKSNVGTIPVYHIWMPNKQCHPCFRILSWLNFHITSTFLSLFIRFKPDVVLAPSPPLLIGLNAWIIAALHRGRYIYNVQEIYPDIAVNLGVVQSRWIISALSYVERMIYRHAAAVTSITDSMCEKIKQRVKSPDKVSLIPNFVDIGEMKCVSRKNSFSEANHLNDCFVVTYAGNVGLPQNLEVLVEAGQRLKTLDSSVRIVIIGDGGAKAGLLKRVHTFDLDNVLILDYMPISMMPEIYAASDLFYVGQDLKACSDGIPSKIYRILGNQKPLLVVTAPQSDLAQFVQKVDSGRVVDTPTPETVANTIVEMKHDAEALQRYGKNGYTYVTSTFERKIISGMYGDLIHRLCEP